MGKTSYKNSFVNLSQVGCSCPKKPPLCGCMNPPLQSLGRERAPLGCQERSTPNLICSHHLSYLLEQGIAGWRRLWARHLSCSSAPARGVSAPLLHPACSTSPSHLLGGQVGISGGAQLDPSYECTFAVASAW